MANRAQRAHLARLMDYLVRNEPRVHYPPGDVRTRTIHSIDTDAKLEREVEAGRMELDCSQSVTMLCHIADLDDPNGHEYREDGYTGTLLAGPCKHYTNPKGANIGALVVFGPGTGHHVCMVRRPDPRGGNPLLFSHGQERGPFFISLSEERKYQPAPVTFLSIARL